MSGLDRGAIAFQAARTGEPAYIVTRKQLVDALAQIELRPVLLSGRDKGVIVAEDMADAILGQIEQCALDDLERSLGPEVREVAP